MRFKCPKEKKLEIEQQKEEAPWAFNDDQFIQTSKDEAIKSSALFKQLNEQAENPNVEAIK